MSHHEDVKNLAEDSQSIDTGRESEIERINPMRPRLPSLRNRSRKKKPRVRYACSSLYGRLKDPGRSITKDSRRAVLATLLTETLLPIPPQSFPKLNFWTGV